MKAITPIISLIMLMLITVGIVGVSYAWFSGLATSSIQKSIAIPPGGAYCSNGEIKAYILNNGDTTLTTQDIIVAQVDGVDVKGTPFFGDISSGLVGWWKFDEESGVTAIDGSGNNNNGNLKPACPDCPAWVSGKSKTAIKFDGVNDYIDAGSAANLRPDTTSIEAWVKYDSSGSFAPLISWGDGYAPAVYLKYTAGNTKPIIILNSGNYQYFNEGSLWDGSWHHVTFVIAGNAQNDITNSKMYIDGIETSKNGGTSSNSPLSKSTPLQVGKTQQGVLKGTIDELKIYNKVTGDINIQNGAAGPVINYPGTEGRHNIRIATSSGAAETTVTCD